MSIRTKATRLGALVGAAALLGGLAIGAGVVHGQTGTATPAAVATQTGPTPASNVGGPSSVPSARFFGSVTLNGSAAPTGTTVTASIGGVACGFGTVAAGQYVVDVQAIQGCTAPGATVNFSVGGAPAAQTGTLPAIEGTAVSLNLTAVAATPAPTAPPSPPPPPPTQRPPTQAPPTQRPPTQAPPSATRAPASPVTQQGAQKPAAPVGQKPAAPVAQKPGAVAQRPGAAAAVPAARPALPNTGTAGLLNGGQGDTTSIALFGIILGAVALSATGLVAYRRSR